MQPLPINFSNVAMKHYQGDTNSEEGLVPQELGIYLFVDVDFSAAWIKFSSAETSCKELMVDMTISILLDSSAVVSPPISV